MNIITKLLNGTIICSCGASAEPSKRGRFLKRHPSQCSVKIAERRSFAKQLASGTRSIDADDLLEPEIVATDKGSLIIHMLNSITTEGRGLTDWENNFIHDLRDQWLEKEWLSDRQTEILEKIYTDRT